MYYSKTKIKSYKISRKSKFANYKGNSGKNYTKPEKEECENNADEANKKQRNKKQHIENGNISHYKILQVNGSHADFCTKITELQTTINTNKSDIIIISESNMEVENEKLIEERAKAFENYNFEDKLVDGNPKARCTLMISKFITYERLKQYEDNLNSSIAIKAKDGTNKWIAIMGIYRQWKLIGDQASNSTEGIKKQVTRLKKQCENINLLCQNFNNCLIGGDINLDRNKKNDPFSRPELRALTPIWEECISGNNLIQLNFKDTWHMPGRRSTLLDLFYCTKPELISNVENTTNLLSEHDRVNLHIHTKEAELKPQFEIRRSYNNVTSSNLLELLDENRNPEIQSLFNTNDPNLATEIFNDEVNKATKKLLMINKFQKKRHQCRYWNKFLEAQKKKVDYLNKIFRQTKSHEDYRMLRNAKNWLTKFTKSAKKEYYKNKYNTNLRKWKELKIEERNENKTLVSANINNKIECSPKTLANEFSKTLLDKIQEIKNELPVNDIIAEKIYKDLVPRNENEIKSKEVTIKEIYEIINKSRPTKSRGNNEVNMYILKQIPQLSAIALTHIINTTS